VILQYGPVIFRSNVRLIQENMFVSLIYTWIFPVYEALGCAPRLFMCQVAYLRTAVISQELCLNTGAFMFICDTIMVRYFQDLPFACKLGLDMGSWSSSLSVG